LHSKKGYKAPWFNILRIFMLSGYLIQISKHNILNPQHFTVTSRQPPF